MSSVDNKKVDGNGGNNHAELQHHLLLVREKQSRIEGFMITLESTLGKTGLQLPYESANSNPEDFAGSSYGTLDHRRIIQLREILEGAFGESSDTMRMLNDLLRNICNELGNYAVMSARIAQLFKAKAAPGYVVCSVARNQLDLLLERIANEIVIIDHFIRAYITMSNPERIGPLERLTDEHWPSEFDKEHGPYVRYCLESMSNIIVPINYFLLRIGEECGDNSPLTDQVTEQLGKVTKLYFMRYLAILMGDAYTHSAYQ
jgi:hypothetical protein